MIRNCIEWSLLAVTAGLTLGRIRHVQAGARDPCHHVALPELPG